MPSFTQKLEDFSVTPALTAIASLLKTTWSIAQDTALTRDARQFLMQAKMKWLHVDASQLWRHNRRNLANKTAQIACNVLTISATKMIQSWKRNLASVAALKMIQNAQRVILSWKNDAQQINATRGC
jgi:hypothetical protein